MAKRLFDVDFFGMVNVTRAVLPHMRQAGRGRIVNVSSVAASLPIPFQAYYSAAKAAVNAYTLALADEVKPFGIGVCAVMPGDIRTGFTAARIKEHTGDDIYHGRIGRSVAKMEQDETHGMPCETAGTHIARIALAKKPGTLHTIGLSYRLDIHTRRKSSFRSISPVHAKNFPCRSRPTARHLKKRYGTSFSKFRSVKREATVKSRRRSESPAPRARSGMRSEKIRC